MYRIDEDDYLDWLGAARDARFGTLALRLIRFGTNALCTQGRIISLPIEGASKHYTVRRNEYLLTHSEVLIAPTRMLFRLYALFKAS